IDRVPFSDAAKIRDHSLSTEKRGAGTLVHQQFAVIDELSPAQNFVVIRNRTVLVLVIEFPESGHDPERHIEFSGGPIADLTGNLQDIAKFGPDRNRLLTCCRVQALNVTVLTPVTQQAFKSFELLKDFIKGGSCPRLIGRPCRQAKFGSHGSERAFDKS